MGNTECSLDLIKVSPMCGVNLNELFIIFTARRFLFRLWWSVGSVDWILCADGGRVRRVHNAAMPLCSEQSHKKASRYHGYSKLTSCMSKLDYRSSMLDNVRLSTCTEH